MVVLARRVIRRPMMGVLGRRMALLFTMMRVMSSAGLRLRDDWPQ